MTAVAAPVPATRRWWPIVWSVGSIVIALAALVLFLAWMGGALCDKVQPGLVAVPRESAAGRPTARVEKCRIDDVTTAVGSVQPRKRTEVSSQLLAQILDVQ